MSPVRRWRRSTGGGDRRLTRWWAAAAALPSAVRSRWRTGRHALTFALLTLAVAAGASSASLAAPVEVAAPDGGTPAAGPVFPSTPYGQFPAFPGGAPGAPGSTGTGAPAAPGSQLQVPGTSDAEVAAALADNGIPLVALVAYRNAERRLARDLPGCGLTWSLLAAIGRVESNHGRFAGAQLLRDGRSEPPIVGIALDGRATSAHIGDTDRGQLDRDTLFDHAVGPMQFIPSTWRMFAVDGDGDHSADPYDIDDAALAAGAYLCSAGRNLRTPEGLHAAVLSYNHSEDYVRLVLDLKVEYERGVRVDRLPPGTAHGGRLPAPRTPPLPPVNPAPPPAVHPDPTPQPTTAAPTSAPTTTPAPTTAPTTTPAPTGTPTPTNSPAPTDSPTPTATPTPTPTCPATPTPTPTETPTPTPTPGPCDTPTPTPAPTQTPSLTSSNTPASAAQTSPATQSPTPADASNSPPPDATLPT